MKRFLSSLALSALSATVAASLATSVTVASATTTTADNTAQCTAAGTKTANTTTNHGAVITVKDGVASAEYKVSGDDNCQQAVTLVSWQAPSANGQPFEKQKLFKSNTQTAGPGVHAISVAVPDCFFQVDLLRGDQATDPNGTPLYGTFHMPWLGAIVGGTKSCEQAPAASVTPTSTPTAPTPTQLANTGPGDVISLAAVVAAVGAIGFSVRQRRALNRP